MLASAALIFGLGGILAAPYAPAAVAETPYAPVLAAASATMDVPRERPRSDLPQSAAFALVVAHNGSLDPDVHPLLYADDDGARFYEVMVALGAQAELLTVLDGDSQETFARLVPESLPPTRANLLAAMDRLIGAMRSAKAAGLQTVFYFYYAGHGNVGPSREGYVNLLDDRLRRSELYREIIARSPADTNHVIVDACNAYFLVHRRGETDPRPTLRAFLQQESLEQYPNTGVILSTASEAESHEWARYRSGIFSHQLISGLLGGAEVDGDGRIEYREIAAYIAAANWLVRDPRARLDVHVEAPARDQQATLLDLGALRTVRPTSPRPQPERVGGFLVVEQGLDGHFFLEDDRGVRYLDFNKTAEQPLRLALLDRSYYYLRTPEQEARIELMAGEELRSEALVFTPLEARDRGTVEQSFRRQLYAYPYGRSFLNGYAAAAGRERDPPIVAAAEPSPEAPDPPWYADAGLWKWMSLGGAGAAGVATVVLGAVAWERAMSIESGSGDRTMREMVDLFTEHSDLKAGAALGLGLTAALGLTAVMLFVADTDQEISEASGDVTPR